MRLDNLKHHPSVTLQLCAHRKLRSVVQDLIRIPRDYVEVRLGLFAMEFDLARVPCDHFACEVLREARKPYDWPLVLEDWGRLNNPGALVV